MTFFFALSITFGGVAKNAYICKRMDMKSRLMVCGCWCAVLLLLAGCHDKESPSSRVVGQTIVVLMPWSTNLKTFFDENLDDMSEAIAEGVLADSRVLVCIASSPSRALLVELKAGEGTCVRDTLDVFENISFTAPSNVTKLLAWTEKHFPAHHYAMILGGHGMAWLPAGATYSLPPPRLQRGNVPLTRWFGGLTADTQIEIPALAEGIRLSGLHFDYLLFDDCYMSSVEVAYELREVTDYVVGCATEIMAYGFPYHECFRYLVGRPDFDGLCATFLRFYQSYKVPCGTVAVIDCQELPALADIARAIGASGAMTPSGQGYGLRAVQQLDGFTPSLFYDLGDLYTHLCSDSVLLTRFHAQLSRAVPHKASTDRYFSAYGGYYQINHFSGVNTSQSSTNNLSAQWASTSWSQAIHPGKQ